MQQSNGSFCATTSGTECDMRFVYWLDLFISFDLNSYCFNICSACAISYHLDDFSGINVDLIVDYISSCLTYEGGFGLIPNSEAHGGSTYCALASLVLLNRLSVFEPSVVRKINFWCMKRQALGFQGRTNKDCDSCYSFWIGASLYLLQSFDDTDTESNLDFIVNNCQCECGGFQKYPDSYPDILHTFYSLTWLSMKGLYGLKLIDAKLGICKDKL